MHFLRRFFASVSLAPLLAATMPLLVAASMLVAQPAKPTAAPTTLSVPPAPLLPEHFGPWQAAGAAEGGAENAIHLDPAVAKELLFQRADVKKYTAEGNAATISAVELLDSTVPTVRGRCCARRRCGRALGATHSDRTVRFLPASCSSGRAIRWWRSRHPAQRPFPLEPSAIC